MAGGRDWPGHRGTREALAEIDGAFSDMVNSTEAPRGFMVALVLLLAAILALAKIASWPVVFGLVALLAPLGLWYWLVRWKPPKPRTVLSRSGPYVGYALVLLMQASMFWEVFAKWIVLVADCWFGVSRMRTTAISNRLKDAIERPV